MDNRKLTDCRLNDTSFPFPLFKTKLMFETSSVDSIIYN